VFVFVLMFLAVRFPAHAQGPSFLVTKIPCNKTEEIMKMLDKRFSEVSIGEGISMSDNSYVKLFVSHNAGDKQTWTIVITYANGLSCMLGGGQDWFVEPEIIVKGDPS
jgi:hypothetical protein